MTAEELRALLIERDWDAAFLTRLFKCAKRTVFRWISGSHPIPDHVALFLGGWRQPTTLQAEARPLFAPRTIENSLEVIGWKATVPADRLGCDPSLVRSWKLKSAPDPDAVREWMDEIATAVSLLPPPSPDEWRRPPGKTPGVKAQAMAEPEPVPRPAIAAAPPPPAPEPPPPAPEPPPPAPAVLQPRLRRAPPKPLSPNHVTGFSRS